MLLHYLGKLESKFGENFTVLLKTCFILLALKLGEILTDFHNSFTPEKKKQIINKTTTNRKTSSESASCERSSSPQSAFAHVFEVFQL